MQDILQTRHIQKMADEKADLGWDALRSWYMGELTNEQRLILRPEVTRLKEKAEKADAQRKSPLGLTP